VSNVVYEHSDSLEPAAEQFDIPLRSSDWFDRFNGSGITAQAVIRNSAFSDEIKQQGLNSEAIQLDNERVVFIRLKDSRPAQTQSLDQVKDRVRNELISQKLNERSVKAGNEGLAGLRSGKALDDLSAEWSTPVIDLGFVGRGQTDVDAQVLNRGFSMPRPDQGMVFDGLSQNGGEYVIIELSAVLSNDVAPQNAEILLQARAGADYVSILKYLGERADVVRTPLEEIDTGEI